MHKCRSISGTLSDETCILGFSSCSNVLRSHHHMLMSIDLPKNFQSFPTCCKINRTARKPHDTRLYAHEGFY